MGIIRIKATQSCVCRLGNLKFNATFSTYPGKQQIERSRKSFLISQNLFKEKSHILLFFKKKEKVIVLLFQYQVVLYYIKYIKPGDFRKSSTFWVHLKMKF